MVIRFVIVGVFNEWLVQLDDYIGYCSWMIMCLVIDCCKMFIGWEEVVVVILQVVIDLFVECGLVVMLICDIVV